MEIEMTKLTRRAIKDLAPFSTEQLEGFWAQVGNDPEHRVKTGRNAGQIKMTWLRYSDVLRAEINRRKK